jgi:hypothetical protein
MGYGEYGGGGSVHWKVVHGGNGGVSAGRDPLPKKDPDGVIRGDFIIVIKGESPITRPITGEHDQIQIFWTPHQPGSLQDLQEVLNSLNHRTEETEGTAAI